MKRKLKGVSLFSSAGIGELFLEDAGIEMLLSNELIPNRAALHSLLHPKCESIIGDINDPEVFQKIIKETSQIKPNFLIATPPCQGFSLAGKNKNQEQMQLDERNYLFLKVLQYIKIFDFDFILIENVPRFLKLYLPYKKKTLNPVEILQLELGRRYDISPDIFDASDFGVPQIRKRAIIRIYKKGKVWGRPISSTGKKITIMDAIGHLPSLESGMKSDIKWHFARKHIKSHICCMRHTPTGKSAFQNVKYTPLTKDGRKPKGFATTYARLRWDEPCPTITIRNDAISSQRNVHPGRKLKDGVYSDARVLSVKELFLLTGLGDDFDLPEFIPENLIRQVIGECVPPKLILEICKKIDNE